MPKKECNHTIGILFKKEDVYLVNEVEEYLDECGPVYNIGVDFHRAILDVVEIKINDIKEVSIPYRYCPYCGAPMSHKVSVDENGKRIYQIDTLQNEEIKTYIIKL